MSISSSGHSLLATLSSADASRVPIRAEANAKPQLLVVDDIGDNRSILKRRFESRGFDVTEAESGHAAIELIESSAFDLVLLDVMMPGIDGLETLRRIRSRKSASALPVIMVTAKSESGNIVEALEQGANDYVTKPVNRIELVARVRSALKIKSELERRQSRERELLSFLSTWGDRRAMLWIDEATGLFVGEVAEAYLTSASKFHNTEIISILALALDRFDAFRSAYGEDASQSVLAEVAHAVRGIAATVGIVAASYRNGLIVLVAPEVDEDSACQLGEKLRDTVAKLKLRNPESIVADHLTASVSTVTGAASGGPSRAPRPPS